MKKLMIAGLLAVSTSMFAYGNDPDLQGRLRLKEKESERSVLKVRANPFSGPIAREEDRESHGPGLYINAGVFLPAADFMNPHYEAGDQVYNLGYAFEVGNFFRFFHTEKIGLGLRATWLQLKYTTWSIDSFVVGNASGSPIRLGPQFSYAINETMGIDVFYQIGPQYNIEWFEGENSSYLGASHELGLAYRFSLFTAGFAYKIGRFKNIDNSYSNILDDERYSAGGIRVFVGIQL